MPREPQDSATKDVVTEVNKEEGTVVTKEEATVVINEEDTGVTKEEALKLTFCCCERCHCESCLCHCLSEFCCDAFPQHSTANQFFTPKMFEAYQKEGRKACEEAKAYDFLKAVCPAGDARDASAELI